MDHLSIYTQKGGKKGEEKRRKKREEGYGKTINPEALPTLTVTYFFQQF